MSPKKNVGLLNFCLCIYIRTHSKPFLQNRVIFTKLGRDEMLMVPYKCCCFSAKSVNKPIQGWAKIGPGGSSSLTDFFVRPEGYSNDPRNTSGQETCGIKCCYFWFNSEIKFLTRFDVFFDLVILLYFNANSIDFYVVKCLIYTYFV